MPIDFLPALRREHPAWNKGRIIGQKRPLLPKHGWSIRVRLEMADNRRDLALFNMAIDSKLGGHHLMQPRPFDTRTGHCVPDGAGQPGRPLGALPVEGLAMAHADHSRIVRQPAGNRHGINLATSARPNPPPTRAGTGM